MPDKKPLQTLWNPETNHWEMYTSMKHRKPLSEYPIKDVESLTKPIPEVNTIIQNPTFQKLAPQELKIRTHATRSSVRQTYPSNAIRAPYHDGGFHRLIALFMLSFLAMTVGLVVGFVRTIAGTGSTSGSGTYNGNYTKIGNDTFTFNATSLTAPADNSLLIGTASAGFGFAVVAALFGLASGAGALYINDRNKRERIIYDNLLEDLERVEDAILKEKKAKEEVLNFLINILARQQNDQPMSRQHLKAHFKGRIAQGIDSFDDLNVYAQIKGLRCKNYQLY